MTMADKKLTITVQDSPYESETTTTVLRIAEAALRKGIDVTVFAYEGAVALPFRGQAPHANPVKGTTVEQQDHPNTKAFIGGLFGISGARFDWINCGLCVDERGVGEAVEGVRRGGPADFFKASEESTNTLVIGTR
jgi:tRNA 2-thiouridine synthesizing protein D